MGYHPTSDFGLPTSDSVNVLWTIGLSHYLAIDIEALRAIGRSLLTTP